jgi:AraC-like DNA-binding protein
MMNKKPDRTAKLIELIKTNITQNGNNPTPLASVELYMESHPHKPRPSLYEAYFIILAQGRKRLMLDDKQFVYDANNFITLLAPIPVICEVIEASEAKPLLAIGIHLDRHRIFNILSKIDEVEQIQAHAGEVDPSSIFTAPLNDKLLDAAIRLLKTFSDPAEAAVVGEAILDEIYFHILKNERGGALIHLLQQRGQIQQIARAVEHVHRNISEVVSVEDMAALVNMSSSTFRKKFKEVMHLSPLQYSKNVKLNKAQTYIMEGKSVSEAGYKVGYNSPAQFSREYKRHFGIVPSTTLQI